jgi:hypothetical protein
MVEVTTLAARVPVAFRHAHVIATARVEAQPGPALGLRHECNGLGPNTEGLRFFLFKYILALWHVAWQLSSTAQQQQPGSWPLVEQHSPGLLARVR